MTSNPLHQISLTGSFITAAIVGCAQVPSAPPAESPLISEAPAIAVPETADMLVEFKIKDASQVYPGYLLWHQADEIGNDVDNDTHLIGPDGRVVNTWPADLTGGGTPAYLLPGGRIVRTGIRDRAYTRQGPIASVDILQIVDRNGATVWEVSSKDLGGIYFHHDIEPMPNGNILVSTYHPMTADDALKLGWQVEDAEMIFPDGVIEIRPDFETGGADIVWAWKFMDHIVQDRDPAAPNYGIISENIGKIDPHFPTNYAPRRSIRQHINSIDYNPDLDQIALSVFIYNEIWVIDRATTLEQAAGSAGDLLFRYGNPAAFGMGTEADRVFLKQHDANWIEPGLPGEGNLLVHNNNTVLRPNFQLNDDEAGAQAQAALEGVSNIQELKLKMDDQGAYLRTETGGFDVETVWHWSSPDYFASFQGGARRLPNGSTLVTNSANNYAVEIGTNDQIVAEYLGPTAAYKAFKYSAEEVADLVED